MSVLYIVQPDFGMPLAFFDKQTPKLSFCFISNQHAGQATLFWRSILLANDAFRGFDMAQDKSQDLLLSSRLHLTGKPGHYAKQTLPLSIIGCWMQG